MDEIMNPPIKGEVQKQNIVSTNVHRLVKSNLLTIFSAIFLFTVFLAPLVTFPNIPVLSFVSKLAVISTLAAVSLIILLVNILSTGEFQFPKSKIVLSLLFIPVTALISSLFSGNIISSLVGSVFEIGTAGSLILMFLLFVLAVFAGSKEIMIKRVVWVFLLSMGLSILYTIFISLMQYGYIPAIAGLPFTLLGNYIDFSILLAAAVVLCLYLLNFSEERSLGKKHKIGLWVFIILSLLIIGAGGFRSIFVVLGIISLIVLTYIISSLRNKGRVSIKKSYSSLAILLLSLIFIISGASLSGYLSKVLKINSFDVRPNLAATIGVVKSEWRISPVTGSGPNRFAELWALYKPMDINQSNFWNVDFSYGSGFVPTLAATTGILGLVPIVVFLLIFIKMGFNVFFVSSGRESSMSISIFMFLTSLFLWIGTIIYTPGLSVLSLTFVFTGLFVASLIHSGVLQNIKINIFSNPKVNFIAVLSGLVLMVGTVSGEYFVWRKIVSSFIFNRAVAAFNQDGDVSKAQNSISKAVSIGPSDLYERSAAELYLLNIEKIAGSIPANAEITEAQRIELESNILNAATLSRKAIQRNPKNYQNYITLGRIYESLAIKGIQGAAENAKSSYTEALKLNPKNPGIQLGLGRVEALLGDAESSRNYINKAIELKSNYTDAYFTLAQFEAASNNVAGVIKAVESATAADPNNASLHFQLGLIKYNIDDFAGAASSLEKAVTLVPDYANSKYFLGLSYYNLKKVPEAIKQFEDLKVTNPDNAEVDLILGNLKSGEAPFTNAKPPIDSAPEKRSSPPIDEDVSFENL